MPKIEVEPERLREFATQLKAFGQVVDESMSRIKSQLGQLGNTWQDQEYEAFQTQFSATHHALKRFAEEVNKTSPLLLRDAEAIQEYQRVKL